MWVKMGGRSIMEVNIYGGRLRGGISVSWWI